MSDAEYVKKKRWEGKPLKFKLRFLLANYPEMGLTALWTVVAFPILAYYRICSNKNGRIDAMAKFKASYVVIRDDHPNLPKILAEKEAGKEFFPKY